MHYRPAVLLYRSFPPPPRLHLCNTRTASVRALTSMPTNVRMILARSFTPPC